MADTCVEAARAEGLTESHAESCEFQRHGCAGCPFRRDPLRDGHREDCAGWGLTEEEEAAEWEAFKADYERWLDEIEGEREV